MSTVYTIRCPGNEKRLDELLRDTLPGLLGKSVSNSKLRRLIVAGAVRRNGMQCRIPGENMHAGDIVTCAVDESRLFYEKPADDISFEVSGDSVLFEDDAVIVVNKPAFFPTEAGMVGSRDNLAATVIRYLGRQTPGLRNPPYVGIMHRLDHETSGVILFTKKRLVNAAVHDMFEQHTAVKRYRAVVSSGERKLSKQFSVEMNMGRISPKSSAAKWGAVLPAQGGVPSETVFSVAGTGKIAGRDVVYIDALPLTGRTHQIRVHLASLGLPLVGDVLYGGIAGDRIMLHAASLSFPHPVTGVMMTVSAPLPRSFGPDPVSAESVQG
jgi:23S rRNA pseudouridine1911/1915/1917 synthase